MPLISEPKFNGGFERLKTEIEKINFSFQSETKDTTICRIELTIDADGKAYLKDYQFNPMESLHETIPVWVNSLPKFKPMQFDGIPKQSAISLAFPVFRGNVLWLGDILVTQKSFRDDLTQIEGEKFFWEYPLPNAGDFFILAEKMPGYPGGESALKAFLTRNIHYPKEVLQQGIEGKVYVSFVINEAGEPTDFKIAKSVHPALDKEALRVVKLMDNWIPGEIKNKKVSVPLTVPINFRTTKSTKQN